MIFKQIGPNRYRVLIDANDTAHHGVVEKQEYVSIDMATGERVQKRFWTAHGTGGGWRAAAKDRYQTREEAGHALLKDSATVYAERRMSWKKKQGQTAAAKGRGE